MKQCLLLGVILAGCTGEIGDQGQMGTPYPSGSGVGANGNTVSSTTDATTSGTGGVPSGSSTTSPSTTTTTGAGGTGGAAVPESPVAAPRLARLTHFQWANSVQDLLRLDERPGLAEDFTPDAIIGFDTNRDQLRMSSTLREDYERAAETLANQVVNDSAALARLIPADAPADATGRAQAFIESFGLRAYRRPLTPDEVSQYLALFERGPELAPELEPFAAGAMLAIRLFLQSPHFLYRTELGQETVAGRIPLSGYEVATKLALAITGSAPDDSLLAAAASGTFDPGADQAALDAEAERLLATPRAKASALHFHTQALALSRYGLIQKSSELYPEFTPETPASMRTSAELFLGALFDAGQGLTTLLSSTEAYVNANLAPIYGVSGTFGAEFERVDLTGLPRRGFLTQPGFLALFAGEHQPDPIHRGVFINQQMLCLEIGPPSGVVIPPLPADSPNETNRDRIDALTGPGTCGQTCHARFINPLGFAFENFDPLGRFRETDNGITVDASGTYQLDGESVAFADGLELSDMLASSPTAHRCYASHWLSYLNGRPTDSRDDAVLDELAARSSAENLSIQNVVRSLVESDTFLTRVPVEQL